MSQPSFLDPQEDGSLEREREEKIGIGLKKGILSSPSGKEIITLCSNPVSNSAR